MLEKDTEHQSEDECEGRMEMHVQESCFSYRKMQTLSWVSRRAPVAWEEQRRHGRGVALHRSEALAEKVDVRY